MADRQLDDVFGIRPVPKRRKNGSLKRPDPMKQKLRAMHECDKHSICIYVIGPDDESVSKVGVSRAPYRRLMDLQRQGGPELRLCYFAEVERAEGFMVERHFHDLRRMKGETIKGEWFRRPRALLTRELRQLMQVLDVTPRMEVGDTGETETGEEASKGWCPLEPFAIPRNRRSAPKSA